MSFYMQNKLSELSNERYFDRSMGVMSEQDRLMRERAAADDVRSRKLKEYETGLNVKEAVFDALLKSNGEPTIDRVKQDIRTYEIAGNQAAKAQAEAALENLMTTFVQTEVKSSKGLDLDTNDIQNIIMSTDTKTLGDMRNRNVDVNQFNRRLPMEQQQADTAKGNLDLAQRKEARSATGQVPQDEYYKMWHSKIEGAKRIILGFKEAYASPDTTPEQKISIEAILSRVNVKPTEFLKTMADLNKMDTLAMTGKFTPNQEKFLDQFGGFGENNPMPETAPPPMPGARAGVSASAGAGPMPSPSVAPPVVAPNPMPTIRKYITDTRTNEQYWIVLRNGQWMRE
jgi:hypothetical protein